MNHDELVQRAVHWLRQRAKCSVVFAELATHAGSTPDAIGWKEGYSVLIECKTSRNDFHKDKKKPYRYLSNGELCMGNERFYMAPINTLKAEDIPEGWGLLEVTQKTVRVVKPSIRWVQTTHALRRELIMLQSAVRRHQLGALWKSKEAKFESYAEHKKRKRGQ